MTNSVVERFPKSTNTRADVERVQFERRRQLGVSITLSEDETNWILETALDEPMGIKPIGGWPRPG